MAEDKRTTPGGKPRRRHTPQIDLTATEITSETPVEPQAPEAAAEPAAKTAKPSAEPPRAAAPPPPPPSAMPTYAAVAGAVIGAVLVGGGVLWFAGLPKENASAGQVNTRLSAIETQIRELAQRPQPQADNRPVEALSQRIAKLEETVSRPPPAPAPDTRLTERIASLESSLTAFNRRLETAQATAQQSPAAQAAIDGLSKRIEGLEQSVKSAQARVEDKIAQNTGADAAARQALASVVLRDAVSRGAPFAPELNALKSLGADPQAVARLEPFAANGVPAPQALAQELSALLPVDEGGVGYGRRALRRLPRQARSKCQQAGPYSQGRRSGRHRSRRDPRADRRSSRPQRYCRCGQGARGIARENQITRRTMAPESRGAAGRAGRKPQARRRQRRSARDQVASQ